MTKRIIIYLVGMLLLTVGIVLNTRTGLGVAAVASFPFAINQITGLSLGNASMFMYLVLVVLQLVLVRKADLKILLQIPFSVGFGVILDFVNNKLSIRANTLVSGLALLLVAVLTIASGVFMMVKCDLILNPVDGAVKTMSDVFKVKFGRVKIIFDASFVTLTIVTSLVFTGSIIGIGIGTVIAVLLMGNTIQFMVHNFDDLMNKVLA